MEEAQSTNDPAQDKNYLRLGRFVNNETLGEISAKRFPKIIIKLQSIDWYTTNLDFYLHGRPNHSEMAFLCLEKDHNADTRPLFLLWQTKEDKGY
ncbi:hypothetical protein NV379_05115 [Paenibacillus sp. N1-5-1-14]|uniref:hypothetical protein n=1 Tax=Paenibacillus radicibacter TaxID=2972488 RepID=UPI0021596162|nr:hypothetical protein [Paenibacillus radicibacter]MCR8642031.1 hypothetical protein [Paenibacillus radicibacter]